MTHYLATNWPTLLALGVLGGLALWACVVEQRHFNRIWRDEE
jgi:hypothetical protein